MADAEQIGEVYRYQFAPLMLLALDHRVGEAKVMKMLRAILDAPITEPADYAEWVRAGRLAGISAEDFDSSFTRAAVERDQLPRARRLLHTLAVSQPEAAVALATALVNVDTAPASRLDVLRALQQLVAKDTSNLRALYQIGKIGAIAGLELDVAQSALHAYLRRPAPTDAPNDAAAHWRLG